MTLTRRQFVGGVLGAALLGGGLWAYATELEPFWAQVVELPMPVPGLPGSLDRARLIHLSDIHAGTRVPDDYLLREFERISALEPDIVVVTGDLTQECDTAHAKDVLSLLPRGRLGTVCTLGNHDYGRAWSEPDKADALVAILKDFGLIVLRNETCSVEGLQFIGMDDLWARRFDPTSALAAADTNRPAICLTHNPDTLDRGGWDEHTGWVLAGHTHGGQVKPPFLDPPQLPVENKRYTSGQFDMGDGRRLYINRGLGFLRQIRFNVRPEITVFELEPA